MANLNLNLFHLGGRLTKDPELVGDGNKLRCKFSIAVNRRYTVEGQDKTDFFDCVAFGQKAEFINRYFHKGSNLYCTGSLEIQRWKADDDKYRQRVEMKVADAWFVDSKGGNGDFLPTPTNTSDVPPEDVKFEELSNESDLPF